LSNVNALAPGERLSFGKAGLTVIYGDNGAGKSGYARVLKQLCRARSPKGDAILPNIYAAASGMPSANIEFYIGGQKRNASWTQGNAPDAMLSAVSVFDLRTANVHVENTNDLAYTPLPLRILAGLAQTCQDVKAKLASDIKALKEQTPAVLSAPDCKPSTQVGKLIESLSGKTKPETVETLAGLSTDEEGRLQTLITDLASDPGGRSANSRAWKPASRRSLNVSKSWLSPQQRNIEQRSMQLIRASRRHVLLRTRFRKPVFRRAPARNRFRCLEGIRRLRADTPAPQPIQTSHFP
jgi:energy-coupling factor transporter ATP-binding protein EcfA2